MARSRVWCAAEIDTLLRLRDQKKTHKQIAAEMGRKKNAISFKLQQFRNVERKVSTTAQRISRMTELTERISQCKAILRQQRMAA